VEDLRVGGIVVLKWILNSTGMLRLGTCNLRQGIWRVLGKTVTNSQVA